jgi:hypothetical protein
MRERDEVWQHGENLFPGFKCMYCLREFQGGGATHLTGKGGNISRCNKCPPDIRNYFLHELQRIRERKKAKKEERFYRLQSTMPLFDDEGEELQETVEVSSRETEFQRRAGERYEHGGESGTWEGEYEDSLGEPRRRGKGVETLMPQEPLHLYKLR